MIHCDTSFLIRASAPGTPEAEALRGWIRERRPVHVGAVAWAEYLCGPLSADERSAWEVLLGDPIALTGAASVVAATLFNETNRRRGTFVDCLIAATAMVDGAALATANPADFARMIPLGLQLAE